MNFDLLEGIILLLIGIMLLSITIYLRKNEKKENIVNEYQSAKHISVVVLAIFMILLGLNKILN